MYMCKYKCPPPSSTYYYACMLPLSVFGANIVCGFQYPPSCIHNYTLGESCQSRRLQFTSLCGLLSVLVHYCWLGCWLVCGQVEMGRLPDMHASLSQVRSGVNPTSFPKGQCWFWWWEITRIACFRICVCVSASVNMKLPNFFAFDFGFYVYLYVVTECLYTFTEIKYTISLSLSLSLFLSLFSLLSLTHTTREERRMLVNLTQSSQRWPPLIHRSTQNSVRAPISTSRY